MNYQNYMYELSNKMHNIFQQTEGFCSQKRQSKKGLFTFYREQQQLEEKYHQILILKKTNFETKAKQIMDNNKCKTNEKKKKKSKQKLNKNRSSKLFKQKSLKDVSKNQSNFQSNRYHDKANFQEKSILVRHNTDKNVSKKKQTTDSRIKNIIKTNISEVSYKFLDKIKSKTEIKSSLSKQTQIKEKELNQSKQQYRKSRTVNISKLQKYEIKKCLDQRQMQLHQVFKRRGNKVSESKLRVRESQQKRIKEKLLFGQSSSINDQILKSVSNVILYSPKKTKCRNRTQPFSIQQQKSKTINLQKAGETQFQNIQYQRHQEGDDKQKLQTKKQISLNKNNEIKSLKFPFIINKNTTKLKNELRKLTQSIGPSRLQNGNEMLGRYHRNLTQGKEKNKYEFTTKNISISKQKLFCYGQTEKQQKQYICVALVDMSKSDVNQVVQQNHSWLQRKKLILKKLGLKI